MKDSPVALDLGLFYRWELRHGEAKGFAQGHTGNVREQECGHLCWGGLVHGKPCEVGESIADLSSRHGGLESDEGCGRSRGFLCCSGNPGFPVPVLSVTKRSSVIASPALSLTTDGRDACRAQRHV